MALFLSLAAFISAGASAQVAQQGEASDERFTSPMVLEIPFHVADPSTWGKGEMRGMDRLARFVCDGVYVRDFAVSVKKERGGKNVKITYYLLLANEPGVDMLALPVIDLVRGEKVLARAGFGWMDVEEGKTASHRVSIVVPVTVITETDAPRLRITITTKRNG
jgi:hypothetical protein